ncbi:hypothetical protein KVE62_01660 [Helicobacter pylori]|nr:hypothetical protein KVE62_01660 [Helicobacter pylori]
MGNKKECYAKKFQKSLFRALCLGVFGFIGGLMVRPNPKELFNLGIKSYKEQDFSQAKEF